MLAAIDNQWLKGVKDFVMVYAKKTLVEVMDWLYICYRQIVPGKLMKNQDTMQASYHVEEPIKIIFYQFKTGQEFAIAVHYTFTDYQLAYMGIVQILVIQ